MAEDTKKEVPSAVPTVTLTIDGQSVSVPKGTTILVAARDMGIHIPTFCWHPKLKVAGSCRMCYVEIEKWPKLAISCATECGEGMVVQTASDLVKQGRRAVLEFILMNHPLDCPTCDQAGECELQNLTFEHGVDDSRFEFQKYRYVDEGMSTTFDDLKIGPEIILNRNRCILCYKCVRSNKEAFGEYDLGCYERGNISQINAAPGEQVDNPFSGNLAETCPVGALTSSDWRYKIRVWQTNTTPSIDIFGSSGANILFYTEDSKNQIRRTHSRCNDDIDDGWLADVARYGYQIINSEDRLTTPLIKKDGKQVPATWKEAVDLIAKKFSAIKENKGGVCIGGLASPWLDNVSLQAFSKLFRQTLGSNNIDFRADYRMLPNSSSSSFSILCDQPFKIADIDNSDVIVMFGSDMVREHPNEYLRVRKARNFGSPRIYSMTPYQVKSSDVADLELIYQPGTEETIISAITLAAIENNLGYANVHSAVKEALPFSSAAEAASKAGVDIDSVVAVAQALSTGTKISFIIGELIAQSRGRDTIADAIVNLNLLFGISAKGQLAVLARYANSRGAMKLGVIPDPDSDIRAKLSELWGGFPDCEGRNTDAMLAQMKKEEIDACMIIAANPIAIAPDRGFVREGLEKLDFLVVADLFETETTELADIVLPLAGWAEFEGDYVNLEGRTQTARAAIKSLGQAKPASEMAMQIAAAMGSEQFGDAGTLADEVTKVLNIKSTMPVPTTPVAVRIEESSKDDEYPILIILCDDPHHCSYLTEKSSSLTGFAGEAYAEMSPESATRYEVHEGDMVRLTSLAGKIILPVKISEYIENNVVLIPRNFTATQVTSLIQRKQRIDWVNISKVDS